MSEEKNVVIPVVEELNGYVTPKKSAEMLGLQVASMSAKIHEGKVDAVKIGGIVLVTRESVERFKAERDAKGLSSECARKMAALLASLSDEELDALIESRKK